MRFRPLMAGALSSVWILVLSIDASACSVSDDYYKPSNFELVQESDAIVIARAAREEKGRGDNTDVIFHVTASLKGLPTSEVRETWAGLGETETSDPGELQNAHPEAYGGPCTRRTFERDSEYVLFLRQADDGTYHVSSFPFARVSEDFLGMDSLWMKTIQYYLGSGLIKSTI